MHRISYTLSKERYQSFLQMPFLPVLRSDGDASEFLISLTLIFTRSFTQHSGKKTERCTHLHIYVINTWIWLGIIFHVILHTHRSAVQFYTADVFVIKQPGSA